MKCVNCPNEDVIYNCFLCSSPLCAQCESKLRGNSVCPGCLERLRQRRAAEYEEETEHLNCPCGFLLGLLIAVGAAVAWSQVALLTGGSFEVGAVLLGGMVGYAVMKGAGDKRGYVLQQIAAVLTLAGILFAYFLVLLRAEHQAYADLSGDSPLFAALCAFPGYFCELGTLAWALLALGALLAYYIPRVRTPPAGL
jgi:hypothetical protein